MPASFLCATNRLVTRSRKPSMSINVYPEDGCGRHMRVVRAAGDVIEGVVEVTAPADLIVRLTMSFCGAARVWVGAADLGVGHGQKPVEKIEHIVSEMAKDLTGRVLTLAVLEGVSGYRSR